MSRKAEGYETQMSEITRRVVEEDDIQKAAVAVAVAVPS